MPAHITHFTYFVPSDVDGEPAKEALIDCALRLQAWYQFQMGNGKTITLSRDIVDVYHTDHPAAWYSTYDSGGEWRSWFWVNCLGELERYTTGGMGNPYDDWVMYIEAPCLDGQYAGGTGINGSGVAVLADKDCRSIRGVDPDWTKCRGIGGCGHELGHTFGLPHPIGDPRWNQAIMGIGYMIFPRSILLPQDKDHLDQNPFFTVQPTIIPPWGLCPQTPASTQRPRHQLMPPAPSPVPQINTYIPRPYPQEIVKRNAS